MAKNLLKNRNPGGESHRITDGTMMTSMGNALRINRTPLNSRRGMTEKDSQKERSHGGRTFGTKKASIRT